MWYNNFMKFFFFWSNKIQKIFLLFLPVSPFHVLILTSFFKSLDFLFHSLTPFFPIFTVRSISRHLQDWGGFTQYELDTGIKWVTMIQWLEWTNNKLSTASHHTAWGHITDVNRAVTHQDTGQYFVWLIIFPYAPGLLY